LVNGDVRVVRSRATVICLMLQALLSYL